MVANVVTVAAGLCCQIHLWKRCAEQEPGCLSRQRSAPARRFLPKVVHATLYDPIWMSHGKSYSNQHTNIFAGGCARLYPDAALLCRRLKSKSLAQPDLQSPCGYMYEADGPDLGYTLNTHHENLQMAYSYWKGTHLGDILSADMKSALVRGFRYTAHQR